VVSCVAPECQGSDGGGKDEAVKRPSALEDPRCAGKVDHRLIDILVITVCAVIACAESWDDIALYGCNKLSWLQSFLTLANGIPSHDTFRRGKLRRKSVSFGQAALPLDRTTTVSTVSKKHRSSRRSAADEATVNFRLSPLPSVCFRFKGWCARLAAKATERTTRGCLKEGDVA
jgi:hypothetical protein